MRSPYRDAVFKRRPAVTMSVSMIACLVVLAACHVVVTSQHSTGQPSVTHRTATQPPNSQPPNSQPPNSQPLNSQPLNSQPKTEPYIASLTRSRIQKVYRSITNERLPDISGRTSHGDWYTIINYYIRNNMINKTPPVDVDVKVEGSVVTATISNVDISFKTMANYKAYFIITLVKSGSREAEIRMYQGQATLTFALGSDEYGNPTLQPTDCKMAFQRFSHDVRRDMLAVVLNNSKRKVFQVMERHICEMMIYKLNNALQ